MSIDNLNITNIPIEVFAAKDLNGKTTGFFISVRPGCGLIEADLLKVDGLNVVALKNKSILPIDFPPLTAECKSLFVALKLAGERLAVAEIKATGLQNAYWLNVDIA